MTLERGVFVVVEPGATQAPVVEFETEPADEVEPCPGVGAEAYNVARIRGDLGFIENEFEHRPACLGRGDGD